MTTDTRRRLLSAEEIESVYREHRETYIGYCRVCEDWTTDCVEPDAEDYECECCGNDSVIGADNWLMEQV